MNKINKFILSAILLIVPVILQGQLPGNGKFSGKVDSIMAMMTLEEKIGQLNQLTGNGEVTGPVTLNSDYIEQIRKGQVGSMLNVNGAEYTRKIQKIAIEESRLGIPLIFGYDVIHGYKTIFPVPLGESASWDLEAIEKAARIAAEEATAAGQHWTFAPMMDISRDARWGRIMEGAGEDPYYGSLVAQARIRGFQGNDFSKENTMLACAKHYVAYGAARGGRDYNTVDMSMRRLHEVFMPPFKAAVDAGVATFMSSFNELNGVPVTGSRELVRGIVKDQWEFDGFIVSDWASIEEMLIHGIAADKYEAGKLAMNAGIDMDMEGHVYIQELKNLLNDGKVSEDQINDAVRRILTKKFELGLFDDPYRYCDTEREKKVTLSDEHRKFAREAAAKSMVLLKNEEPVLPLSKDLKDIALIGPLVKAKKEYIGTWSARGEGKHVVSVMQGFKNKLGNEVSLSYAKGAEIEGDKRNGFEEALTKAREADAIVAVVGEKAMMSGEALSRMHIGLPGVQEELVMELAKLDKPLVVVLMNGRPLAIPELDKNVPAILEAWLPGTEGGNALADIIFGDVNPSGKLTASFPWHVGQVPVNYEHKNTGRPKTEERYTTKYIDGPNEPLYPFGYGLSYTSFKYSKPELNRSEIGFDDNLEIRVKVRNTGNIPGEEVVQLYVRDMVGSVTRPVKELKGFRKIAIEPGEQKEIVFKITAEDLAFYNKDMKFKAEPGEFKVFTGSNSSDVQENHFKLVR